MTARELSLFLLTTRVVYLIRGHFGVFHTLPAGPVSGFWLRDAGTGWSRSEPSSSAIKAALNLHRKSRGDARTCDAHTSRTHLCF